MKKSIKFRTFAGILAWIIAIGTIPPVVSGAEEIETEPTIEIEEIYEEAEPAEAEFFWDEPEETEPEVIEPEETEPEVIEPEETEPEIIETEETEPEIIEPEETEPEIIEPEETEPEVIEPAETEPEIIEPNLPEPEEIPTVCELQEHIHSDECYSIFCELPEHIHTEECGIASEIPAEVPEEPAPEEEILPEEPVFEEIPEEPEEPAEIPEQTLEVYGLVKVSGRIPEGIELTAEMMDEAEPDEPVWDEPSEPEEPVWDIIGDDEIIFAEEIVLDDIVIDAPTLWNSGEEADEPAEEPTEYAFAIDITLYDEFGEVWQPDEPVTVTLDACALGLNDGDEVQILHEHDGWENDLGVYVVEDGLLTFEVDGFSVVRGVLVETVELTMVEQEAEMLYAAYTDGQIIYLDLYYGDVTITDQGYSGYVLFDGDTQATPVSGSHNADNEYYIFQSNPETDHKGSVNKITNVLTSPGYDRVMEGKWGEYITNNTNVVEVIKKWDEEAGKVKRDKTPTTMGTNDNLEEEDPKKRQVAMHHRIIIQSDASVTTSFDVTIDNVWSGFQNDDLKNPDGKWFKFGSQTEKIRYRTSGGITFRPGVGNTTTQATFTLVGDNRFGNIHYETGSGAGGAQSSLDVDSRIEKGQLIFDSKKVDGIDATLTVANLEGDTGDNHFCSAIGGANSPNYSPGLKFDGGIIYAGTTERDNCTAIGGGGCGFGGVTITDGIITAVAATNGTAIGGGIGDGGNGGAGDIYISGGIVYAYNNGLAIIGTRNSGATEGAAAQRIAVVMPAVAIGSGSSRRDMTVPAKIKITNGEVYAQSVGGTAIGGGSSVNFNGANATITISGGKVTAKSVAGSVKVIYEKDKSDLVGTVEDATKLGLKAADFAEKNVSASVSIGGGTAGVPFRFQSGTTLYKQGNGGTATLTISGEDTVVLAGSIGGGGVNVIETDPFVNDPDYRVTQPDTPGKISGKIGAAQVTISSGTVQGQVIMAKGTDENNKCSFDMTGGTIDNGADDITFRKDATDAFVFLQENGGAVYIEDGTATMSGGTIQNAKASDGGAFYIIGGSFTMTGGTIQNCTTTENGGAIYIEGQSIANTCNISNGTIYGNSAVNGGGFYIKNATINVNGGSITGNSATENGGAIYIEGQSIAYTCNISNGTIYGNSAVNGGGFYIKNATIDVNGGSITGNKAEGFPSGIATACDSSRNQGVGGGVYVEDGVFSMKTAVDEDEINAVGLYGNLADFAADDVYATPGSTITIPAVENMNLIGEHGQKIGHVTNWFEDYADNDTKYTKGLQKGNYDDGDEGIDRYREASNDNKHAVTEAITIQTDKYVCLTLGYTLDHIILTIQKIVTGNMGDRSKPFEFEVKYYSENEIEPVTEEFTLVHDGEKIFKKVLKDKPIIITEKDSGYTVTAEYWKSDDTIKQTGGQTTEIAASYTQDENITVLYTNHKEADIDTAVTLDILPYIILFSIVGTGVILASADHRRRTDED